MSIFNFFKKAKPRTDRKFWNIDQISAEERLRKCDPKRKRKIRVDEYSGIIY